jgi:hypothetical protein
LERTGAARQNLRSLMAKKRFGSIMLYTAGALVLAVSASFLFNFMDHDTEFAIAVTGSLIGGFLGAMLAAAVIVDGMTGLGETDQK